VLFHGTAEKNLHSILENGFVARPPLESISFAKNSRDSLSHWYGNRSPDLPENGLVIAVRFESLNVQGIQNNISDIHVYKAGPIPKIIGYCVIPSAYKYI
jgi:hypothetical protein